MVKLLIEWLKAKNLYQRSSDSNILKRDDKCGKDLSWWNCNNFGNVRRDLEIKKALLVQAKIAAIRSGCNIQLRELKVEINVLLDKESCLWGQRSRVLWLSKGDQNMKYFHSRATK